MLVTTRDQISKGAASDTIGMSHIVGCEIEILVVSAARNSRGHTGT